MTIAILGGGITGLAAAWTLQQHGVPYTLFERSDRLGGKVHTERVDGFAIESGPDSFLSSKPWTWQLADALGLRDRIISTRETQRAVYVLKNGTLHRFPKGMRLIVPVDPTGVESTDLMTEAGKARMLGETAMQPYLPPADESLAEFVIRHFGSETLDVFAEPLLAGIYVGNPREMSLRATYPQYHELAASHGSLIRAMREIPPAPPIPGAPSTPFFTFKGGTGDLIDALVARLTGEIVLGQPVTPGITEDSGNLQWTVNGRPFDRVISALPATALHAVLTECTIGADPQSRIQPFIKALQPFVGNETESVVITIACKRSDLSRPLDGSGFVVPRSEPTPVQACTWSSNKFEGRAPDDCALIRTYLRPERIIGDPVDVARDALAAILGLDRASQPILTRVHIWKNPQYRVGHLERVAQLEAACPSEWALAGSAFYGVGVPDCIHQAERAVDRSLTPSPENSELRHTIP